METLIPQHLNAGDVVGIVAPAGPITEKQAEQCAEKVKAAGFTPLLADGICKKFGYLAGTDVERASQLNKMFNNKNVKAIICARGGYGTSRILDYLDYDLIKENPKILGGYSDITALSLAVYKKTQLVTFHSSMLVPQATKYTEDSMWQIFQHGKKGFIISCEYEPPQNDYVYSQKPTVLKSGKCRGTLIGGNLTLLETLIGRKYENIFKNKILFIEEVNEPPYKIDRMLTHLRNSINFSGIKGIIFGKMKGCEAQDKDSLPLDYVIDEFCLRADVPTIKYFSFGHVSSRCTFPIGVKVEMDTNELTVKLLEDCVD